MSDNQSWYQRKMAQIRGQQAPYQVQPQAYAQPQQYVQPQQYNQPMAPQQQNLYPPQFQQMPQQQQAPPQVTIDNLWGAMHMWKGGQAHKIDREPCPSCGSNQYYSRAAGKRGPPPAPHCYNCGYNDGLFAQGDPTTWGMTG